VFDTATSYYYLCDFDQAEVNWNDCLRIIRTHETEEKSYAWRQGIVLYCLVLNRIACRTTYDANMFHLLNEAQTLLSTSSDKTILAYMEFLTAKFLHKTASKVPPRIRTQLPFNVKIVSMMSCSGGLSWDETCKTALSLLEQVKNECWFDLDFEETANTSDLKHLPMSAHVFLLEGQVNELMGRSQHAMSSYQEALNFYRIACGKDNVYSASVLHRMGMLCAHSKENGHKALGFFNDSISMRKLILGGNDPRLAETLYCSASVLAVLYRYECAMERYHEALRIQMASVGQSSNEVATTLTGKVI
jgi:tetratricopeptide (TPR) repeat protein